MKSDSIIDGRIVGEGHMPYMIAEVSANHNGSIENAMRIIEFSKRAGANAVKLQTYTPDTITLNCDRDDFQIKDGLWAGRSLYELYDWAHTPWAWHETLFAYARNIGISIFSSPFDETAVDLLESLGAPAYKIASFECVDTNLIRCAAETKKPIIISTGMANAEEIGEAVEVALKYGSGQLTLLHCVSGYPAPAREYNLKTLADMRSRFGVNVGLSDHTLDNVTSIAAISLGAVMIEKHVTLDRRGGGPDDSFSLEEKDLKNLCEDVATAWSAIGDSSYERSPSEVANIKFRRSLYFVRDLKAGEIIREADIRSIRPGYGIAPREYDNVVGCKVAKDVSFGYPVTWEVIVK